MYAASTMAADVIHETVDPGTASIVCQAAGIAGIPKPAAYGSASRCTMVEPLNENIHVKDVSHEKNRSIAVGFKFNLPG